MRRIDWRNPIDWQHPDNAGLVFAMLNLPGLTGGGRWPDAMGRTAGVTLGAAQSWSARGLASTQATSGSIASLSPSASISAGDCTIIADCETSFVPASAHRFFRVDSRLAMSLRINPANGSGAGIVREGIAWHNTAVTVPANTVYRCALVKTGGNQTNVNLTFYIDATQRLALTNTTLSTATPGIEVGGATEAASSGQSLVRNAWVYNRALTATEIARDLAWFQRYVLTSDYQSDPRLRRLSGTLYGFLTGTLPTITGTLDATQDAQTLAASGTVAVSGSVSTTQDAQTLAATGTVSVSGSAAITQAEQTATGSGAVLASGSAAITQADQAGAGVGAVLVVGSVNVTQAAQAVSATGTVGSASQATAYPFVVMGIGLG